MIPKDLVIPPPEIRSVVDKTAEFVAKMGDEFEKKVIQQQGKDRKFGFLLADNPYRRYYEQRVKDLREGRTGQISAVPKALEDLRREEAQKAADGPASKKKSQLFMLKDEIEVAAPGADMYAISYPSGIGLKDIERMKLTALFVARNGELFAEGLAHRESRNKDFDFLSEDSDLHTFFTKMVETYSRVLLIPKETKEWVDAISKQKNWRKVLEKCTQRWVYESRENQKKKKI